MQKDGEKYMKPIVAFSEYAKAPKTQKQTLNWGMYCITQRGFGVRKCNINEFKIIR